MTIKRKPRPTKAELAEAHDLILGAALASRTVREAHGRHALTIGAWHNPGRVRTSFEVRIFGREPGLGGISDVTFPEGSPAREAGLEVVAWLRDAGKAVGDGLRREEPAPGSSSATLLAARRAHGKSLTNRLATFLEERGKDALAARYRAMPA